MEIEVKALGKEGAPRKFSVDPTRPEACGDEISVAIDEGRREVLDMAEKQRERLKALETALGEHAAPEKAKALLGAAADAAAFRQELIDECVEKRLSLGVYGDAQGGMMRGQYAHFPTAELKALRDSMRAVWQEKHPAARQTEPGDGQGMALEAGRGKVEPQRQVGTGTDERYKVGHPLRGGGGAAGQRPSVGAAA